MKHILFSILVLAAHSSYAQNDTTRTIQRRLKTNDEVLPPVTIDLNFKYGWGVLDPTLVNLEGSGGYGNLSTTEKAEASQLTFHKPKTIGGDIQFGYFFGTRRNFGIGTGFMFLQQKGEITLDGFKAVYARQDVFQDGSGNNGTYKQIITSNHSIQENYTNVTMNVPLVGKFKHQFKDQLGVFVDAGAVFSLSSTNTVDNSNASFDYEAIYLYDDNGKAIYDANSVSSPNNSSILLTKDFIMKQNTLVKDNTVAAFFDENFQGYNVGLNKTASAPATKHDYKTFAIGALIQGGFSYQLNYRVTANIGGFYMYQVFKNDKTGKLTDKVGDYNSLFPIIEKTNVQTYGINLGIRYFLGRDKDIDGDMIPDAKDECARTYGLAAFNGCPDSDGDGVVDAGDHCPFEFGVECTFGCPDRDGDCVPDERDLCPDVYAESGWATMGCPDRDKDGVADKDDNCPDEAGLNDLQHHGCPEGKTPFTAPDPATVAPSHIVLSKSVVNFKSGKKDIDSATLVQLNDIVKALNEDARIKVFISGHTDDVGSYARNMMLSFERAEALKSFLVNRGINKDRIMISGYGKMDPIIENDSPENRAKNRRIEVRMLMPLW